jgi:hypothetical protein
MTQGRRDGGVCLGCFRIGRGIMGMGMVASGLVPGVTFRVVPGICV